MPNKLKSGHCIIGAEVPTEVREYLDLLVKNKKYHNRSVALRLILQEYMEKNEQLKKEGGNGF
ncbi:MAG: hypothetical protein AB1779_05435 [Candidatus Thermoplasmatota archaeon]